MLGGTFALLIEGLTDVSVERAHLEKKFAGIQGRLDDRKFRENATEDVIAETGEAASLKAEGLGRLGTALGRIKELD